MRVIEIRTYELDLFVSRFVTDAQALELAKHVIEEEHPEPTSIDFQLESF